MSGFYFDNGDGVCLDLNAGSNILGRCPITKIRDICCSRKQVEIDVYADTVWLMVIGSGVCLVAGRQLRRGQSCRLCVGDRLSLTSQSVGFTLCRSVKGDVERKRDVVTSEDKPALPMSPMKQTTLRSFRRPAAATVTSNDSNNDSGSDGSIVVSWRLADNDSMYLMQNSSVMFRTKVAAFDLDGTLITTRSGRVFPVDSSDWRLLMTSTATKLQQLHEQGYRIVIFTNQLGVSRGKTTPAELRQKLSAISTQLAVPLQCFVAHRDNSHRKPRTGMWEYLIEQDCGGVTIDMSESFYCGDAAGRLAGWASGKKKDFSCADRLFALNVGLKFLTPEELFLGHVTCTKFQLPEFNPRLALSNNNPDDSNTDRDAALTRSHSEVVVLVGAPASGKSHLASRVFSPAGYIVVNRDTLNSWQKCVRLVQQTLTSDKRAVVDNTNGDIQSRQRYIEMARKYDVPVRCIIMPTSLAQCRHNNKFRQLVDPSHQFVSDVVINSYRSNYVPPTKDEGFSEITTVAWRPSFSSEKLSRLYQQYLIDK